MSVLANAGIQIRKENAITPKLNVLAVAIACVFAAGQAQANGIGPTVVAGQAGFVTTGDSLVVTNSPGAIINWQSFSINAGESTRFIQSGPTSSVLNRVIGADPSVILGTLTSNGRVFLINPGGILFGQGSRIDVAGLVASTLNLSNHDFLAGRLDFVGDPLAGKVENRGSITTPSGGSVYLVGAGVANSGIISSPQGDVILAAGQSVKIFDSSTPGVRVELTAKDNATVNLGEILAHSGEIGIYGATLGNAGIINADQVEQDASGKIVLRAKQDVTLAAGSRISASGEQGGVITIQSETGNTLASGAIDASGTGAGQIGGTVHVLGQTVSLAGTTIDATGDAGGGTVLVGGNFHGAGPEQNSRRTSLDGSVVISADASYAGNGGRIAVWSDGDTSIGGTLTARGGVNSGDGGFIETSGKHVLLADGSMVNTLAPYGKAGMWLLDPVNWTIAAAGDETPASVVASLATTDRTILADNDITVAEAVIWTTAQTLTLNAGHDVLVNAAMTASTAGAGIVLIAGNDVTATAALTASALGAVIDMSAGHNVSVGVVTASGGGSVNLRGNNDVIVNGLITADTGLDSVVLLADNDGTGPGIAGGTVKFVGTGAVVTPRTIIRFNPDGYINTSAEIANYVTKVSAILDAKAWVFVKANDRTYNGTTSATAAFRGDPTVGSTKDVSLTGGAISFADKSAGGAKAANFSGYSIAGADSGDYALFAGAGSTTAAISQAPLTVTASNQSKTYGTAFTFAGSEFTSTGLQNAETIGSVTLTSAGAAATAHVAGSPYTITPSAATGGTFTLTDYAITYNNALTGFTVNPAALGIAANSATRLYGDANPVLSATYTGFQNGETAAALTGTLALNTAAIPASNVGGYAIIPAGQSSTDYTITYVNGSLGVIPAPLGIAANSSSKTYGSTVSFAGIEFSSTGLKNGETVGSVSLASAGAAATADVAGGPYTITPSAATGGTFSAGNYTIDYVDGTLGVIRAPLGIAANSTSKTYGDTVNFTGAEFSSTGLKNSETIGSVSLASAGAASTADVAGSPYVITASAANGGTFDPGNYTISYIDGSLGVIPAGLLGIAANAAVKTYDGLAYSGGNGVNYTGFQGADTPASLNGTLVYGGSSQGAVNVGNYSIIPSGQSSPNYTIVYVPGTLGVIPAALGIAANSASRLYGDANPAFSATYTGFQNGETAAALTGTLAMNTSAIPTSNAGSYAIVPSGQSSTNYTIDYVNGTMAVTARPIFVSANAGQTKIYGGADPALAYSVSVGNLVNGDVLALTRLAGENVGDYAISLTPNINYNITYTGANFAITPAELMVTANSLSKVYGTSDPVLGYSANGFQFTDTTTVLSGALSRTAGENVGSYAIEQNTLASNANYIVTYVGNNLSVTPAVLTVAAHPQSKLFGTSDPALTFSVAGLVNSPALGIADTAGTVLSGALTRIPGESALGGPYAITQGTLATNSNYSLSFMNSNLVITGAAAEPVLGFNAGQVVFAGVINNDFYYRPGNFWHISLNSNNADPGFDVMRGTNDSDSRLSKRMNSCDSVSGGGFCETWSFPQQREKVDKK